MSKCCLRFDILHSIFDTLRHYLLSRHQNMKKTQSGYCQTFAAAPAEPVDLPKDQWGLGRTSNGQPGSNAAGIPSLIWAGSEARGRADLARAVRLQRI